MLFPSSTHKNAKLYFLPARRKMAELAGVTKVILTRSQAKAEKESALLQAKLDRLINESAGKAVLTRYAPNACPCHPIHF